MSADQDISQNSRKAKHHGPDARLSDRNRRETGLISYHRAVLRNLTAYFALGGVIVGLRPYIGGQLISAAAGVVSKS
jgi:hypothetical protein